MFGGVSERLVESAIDLLDRQAAFTCTNDYLIGKFNNIDTLDYWKERTSLIDTVKNYWGIIFSRNDVPNLLVYKTMSERFAHMLDARKEDES